VGRNRFQSSPCEDITYMTEKTKRGVLREKEASKGSLKGKTRQNINFFQDIKKSQNPRKKYRG